jgi:hypothetical protein
MLEWGTILLFSYCMSIETTQKTSSLRRIVDCARAGIDYLSRLLDAAVEDCLTDEDLRKREVGLETRRHVKQALALLKSENENFLRESVASGEAMPVSKFFENPKSLVGKKVIIIRHHPASMQHSESKFTSLTREGKEHYSVIERGRIKTAELKNNHLEIKMDGDFFSWHLYPNDRIVIEAGECDELFWNKNKIAIKFLAPSNH